MLDCWLPCFILILSGGLPYRLVHAGTSLSRAQGLVTSPGTRLCRCDGGQPWAGRLRAALDQQHCDGRGVWRVCWRGHRELDGPPRHCRQQGLARLQASRCAPFVPGFGTRYMIQVHMGCTPAWCFRLPVALEAVRCRVAKCKQWLSVHKLLCCARLRCINLHSWTSW